MREITPFDLGGWSNPGGTVLIGGGALQTSQLKGIMRQRWLKKEAEKWDLEGNKCLSYIKGSSYGSF